MQNNHLSRLICTAIMALALAACGKQPVPQGTEAQAAVAAAAPVTAVVKAQRIVPPAPRTPEQQKYQKKDTYFSVPAVAGGKMDLADYAGRPVMFMLFTETCPYCRKAGPALERFSKAYGPKGLAVLGLCIQDEPQAARNFADDLGITFPLGYAARDVYRQYRAQGVPFIFLLDREHKVASVWPGYAPDFDGQIKEAIEKALRK